MKILAATLDKHLGPFLCSEFVSFELKQTELFEQGMKYSFKKHFTPQF